MEKIKKGYNLKIICAIIALLCLTYTHSFAGQFLINPSFSQDEALRIPLIAVGEEGKDNIAKLNSILSQALEKYENEGIDTDFIRESCETIRQLKIRPGVTAELDEFFGRLVNSMREKGYPQLFEFGLAVLDELGEASVEWVLRYPEKTIFLFEVCRYIFMNFNQEMTILSTYRCNYECKHCALRQVNLKDRVKELDLPIADMERTIRELKGFPLVTFSGGELFEYMNLHIDEIFDIVNMACEYAENVQIISNLSWLPEEYEEIKRLLDDKIQRNNLIIRASLDVWHYREMRKKGKDLYRIIKNLERYRKEKGRIKVMFNIRLNKKRKSDAGKIELDNLLSKTGLKEEYYEGNRNRFNVSAILKELNPYIIEDDIRQHQFPDQWDLYLQPDGELVKSEMASYSDKNKMAKLGQIDKETNIFDLVLDAIMKYEEHYRCRFGGEKLLRQLKSRRDNEQLIHSVSKDQHTML